MKCSQLLFSFFILLFSCSSDNSTEQEEKGMYFPPNNSTTWETKTPESLGWNLAKIEELKTYLSQKNSKSFIVLHNGKIVMEEYFNGHSQSTIWQWNSAGKTLTTVLSGIAQQENLLNINQKVSDFLGTGWTSSPLVKENMITCKSLLTMTSGIDDSQSELTNPANLQYLADAGTRWAYHNIFQKQMDVIASASNTTFDNYFNSKLKTKIGMEGSWYNGVFKIYYSNTRSMARFGLLSLNKGKWQNEQILNETFFNESISSSQSFNPSYGYLWWLNGKASYMVPGTQLTFQGNLVPNAPPDMYAAMGANDQRIYVVPSKNLVVIRMGNAANPSNPTFAVSGFDNELWQKINEVIN